MTMLLFQPLPLTGTMNAAPPTRRRPAARRSLRSACRRTSAVRRPLRTVARRQIEVHDQDAVLAESGIERHEVAQAAHEQQRADDQHERHRDLRDDQRRGAARTARANRSIRGCPLSSRRRAASTWRGWPA